MPLQRSHASLALALLACGLSVATLVATRKELVGLQETVASYGAAPATVSPEAVRQALLANPRMLIEAGQALQRMQRDEQKKITVDLANSAKADLETPTHSLIGNPNGKHEMVEFFDYRCPHCREIEPFLRAEAKTDPELHIIRREIAVLGDGSEIAARVALAAAKQGAYEKVSAAMLAIPEPVTVDTALAAAVAAGADADKIKADMASPDVTAELAANQGLSVRVAVTGTPAFSAPGAGTINGVANEAEFRAFAAASRP